MRVVSEAKGMLGVKSISGALELARAENLDLVEISPNAKPPVCKIMDYGKFKYEQDKKAKLAKKNQKIVHLKEIKLRPNIGLHDLEIKLNHAEKFLKAGDKVKFSLRFRGREIAHSQIGYSLFNKVKEHFGDQIKVELEPKFENRQILMIIAPIEG